MRVHLVGVAGTGMGSLAGLLRKAGHEVTGSDVAFYPPMGDALKRWGVTTFVGFDPAHLGHAPDLVVIGNVCRSDNVEARAAIDGGLPYASFPATLARFFLEGRPSYVVAGTHGKTTTSSLLSYLLSRADRHPGYLIGGVPLDFDESFAVGARGAPFVVEGDEYDSAFFEKTPKFWSYKPRAVIVTSIEHDHIDIYRDMDAYRKAFEEFVERIPSDGLLVAYAGDPEVRRVARLAACPVRFYALEGDDCGDVAPVWLAALCKAEDGVQPFDLFVGGSSAGRIFSPLAGAHNVRNAVAALALASEAARVPLPALCASLKTFQGVRRRLELLASPGRVSVYDDFAHHPTAVRETLLAAKSRHPGGRVIAVFEPRSATASRKRHQEEYPASLRVADLAVIAPVGRKDITAAERLDTERVAADVQKLGGHAVAAPSIDAVVARVAEEARAGDAVVIMSNGAFEGAHGRIVAALTARTQSTKEEPS